MVSTKKNNGQPEEMSDGYIEKLVAMNRTVKVVRGGRVFSFSALIVAGDGKGRIGVGKGKAKEMTLAIQKAKKDARSDMVRIPLNGDTLHHALIARFGAARVFMRPASDGTGIIAGGTMRAAFEVLGVKNVLAKCIGSTNPSSVLRATLNGLQGMFNPTYVANKRGKTIKEIFHVREETEKSTEDSNE